MPKYINEAIANTGKTPLYVACVHSHVEIVKCLLECTDIDINKARTDVGYNPLHIACVKGELEIVKLLNDKVQSLDF